MFCQYKVRLIHSVFLLSSTAAWMVEMKPHENGINGRGGLTWAPAFVQVLWNERDIRYYRNFMLNQIWAELLFFISNFSCDCRRMSFNQTKLAYCYFSCKIFQNQSSVLKNQSKSMQKCTKRRKCAQKNAKVRIMLNAKLISCTLISFILSNFFCVWGGGGCKTLS